jgi:hypothetical protein
MGKNVPYTSYLSQKEHSFIEKCNFGDDLKFLACKGLSASWLNTVVPISPGVRVRASVCVCVFCHTFHYFITRLLYWNTLPLMVIFC